jgi:tol-pal system protein YbgF
MKHTLIRSALATLVFIGLVAPSSVIAADKETRQMMADIRMLQEQLQLVQNLFGSTIESLKALNARIDQQVETNRKSFADQKLTIDAVAGDLRIVRERMDDNNVRIGSLTQEVDALRQTVLQLNVATPPALPPIESGDPAASAGAAPAAAFPPPSSAPAIAGGLSPQRAFDMAKADYYVGQYELAISGLEAYVRTFPKSEQAGEAQFLIGASYSQLGKHDKAVEAYDLTIRTYPRSSSIPEAYYRKGVALRSLRQLDEARQAFEWVIKNFPDSAEATLAKQGFDQLTPSSPATRKP